MPESYFKIQINLAQLLHSFDLPHGEREEIDFVRVHRAAREFFAALWVSISFTFFELQSTHKNIFRFDVWGGSAVALSYLRSFQRFVIVTQSANSPENILINFFFVWLFEYSSNQRIKLHNPPTHTPKRLESFSPAFHFRDRIESIFRREAK